MYVSTYIRLTIPGYIPIPYRYDVRILQPLTRHIPGVASLIYEGLSIGHADFRVQLHVY